MAQPITQPSPEASGGEPLVRLRNTTKVFGKVVRAVDGLNLDIAEGEFFSLLGPSGCGKTTTLRLIAGLEEPDDGEISVGNQLMASARQRIFVPPEKRRIGMVFQSYAVWPHMTVGENVAYPLEIRRMSRDSIRAKVASVLDLLGLGALADRQPSQLSGGQQQRVALARALVHEPRLLLLDEPFSNLDAGLRHHMRVEMKVLQKRLGITMILVTHDQEEALILSDRLAIMRGGTCEQVGAPTALYERPVSPYVRDFLGKAAVLEGIASGRGENDDVSVELIGSEVRLVSRARWPISSPEPLPAPVDVAIRPEYIRIVDGTSIQQRENTLPGVVDAVLFMGKSSQARVTLWNDKSLLVPLQSASDVREGDRVALQLPAEHVTLWPQA